MNVYWIKSGFTAAARSPAAFGFGVTAIDEADALHLVKMLLESEGKRFGENGN